MNGQNSDDRQWPGSVEDHRSLADAYVRIDTARRNLELLHAEVSNFVRNTVEMMVRGWSRERNTFVVNLPPADLAHKGKVNNKIRRLCGSITEDLRAALDYGITKVANVTKPDMVEREKRAVQFIIAHDEISFKRQAKRALKYVGEPKRSLEEILAEHASDIPDEEWDRLPDDLIENLDHYTAGADKYADRSGRNVEEILEDYAGRVPTEEWAKLPPDLIERLDHYTSGADI